MLTMECPNCKEVIRSHLLGEIKVVFCKHCKTNVPVQDVHISASVYTMRREDLLNRIYRYGKLLVEAEKEMEYMIKDSHMSKESIKSMGKFIIALRELLNGARNNFRVCVPPTAARYEFGNMRGEAMLVDLSIAGACIEPEESKHLPRIKSDISLNFSLPNIDTLFSIKGIVAWIRKEAKQKNFKTGIGVKFEELQETTRSLLWKFISMHGGGGVKK